MQVHLTNAGAITLCQPDVFTQLEVLVDPQTPTQLEQAIARIGHREGPNHVRLAPSVLRFLSGHAGKNEWEAGFAGMLSYASQKGWVNALGEVRAHLNFNTKDTAISVGDFKAAMRALPAGIAAVTTECDGEVAGMIVSSLTSISADPPMVGFFAHQDASINQPMTKSGRFVANILGEDHRAVMADFLQLPQGISRFKQGNWGRNPHNIPLLQDALASLECDIVFTQTLGTHQLIVGKIRKSAHAYANPLVYFNANTHNLLVESEVEPT